MTSIVRWAPSKALSFGRDCVVSTCVCVWVITCVAWLPSTFSRPIQFLLWVTWPLRKSPPLIVGKRSQFPFISLDQLGLFCRKSFVISIMIRTIRRLDLKRREFRIGSVSIQPEGSGWKGRGRIRRSGWALVQLWAGRSAGRSLFRRIQPLIHSLFRRMSCSAPTEKNVQETVPTWPMTSSYQRKWWC